MKKIILHAFFLALIVVSQGLSQEQQAVVTVRGYAGIVDNDLAAARDRAIDDALRKAVQQALGVNIQSQTLVENFQLVDDNILSWAEGYVSSYKVLSEKAGQYMTYEVMVEAKVDLNQLRASEADLRALLERMGNPRMLILIDEQSISSGGQWDYYAADMTAAETAMIQVFRDKGFEVLDPDMVKANLKRDQIMAALGGDSRAAAAIAARQDAELIVTGKAVVRHAREVDLGGGMKSYQANITARVVKADVATIVASGSERAAYPHLDDVTGSTEAIARAARKLAEKLSAQIAKHGRQEFYNWTTVKLVVTQFPSYSELLDFSMRLKYYVRGVKDIKPRNITGPVAEMDVRITGSAQQLARAIATKNFGPLKPEVLGLSQNRITISLVSASKAEPAAPDTAAVDTSQSF